MVVIKIGRDGITLMYSSVMNSSCIKWLWVHLLIHECSTTCGGFSVTYFFHHRCSAVICSFCSLCHNSDVACFQVFVSRCSYSGCIACEAGRSFLDVEMLLPLSLLACTGIGTVMFDVV